MRKAAVLWFLAVFAAACPAAAQKGELVSLPGIAMEPGQELQGMLFRPTGKGPFPAVVAMHGCSGLLNADKRMFFERDIGWSAELPRLGYMALFIDSFRSRGIAGGCTSGDPPTKPWRERARDAYAGLAWLQRRPDVIADRIALIGWSHGGATVLFTAARNDAERPATLPLGDFRAAVAFYPGWCRSGWIGPGWAPAMPLLVLIGGADNWTRAQPCLDALRASAATPEQVETAVYPGAYHDFDSKSPVHTITIFNGSAGTTTVFAGGNPEARAAAYKRVGEYFAGYLRP